MTLARSSAEAAALRTSLGALVDLGLPVIVTDGGSPPEFVRDLGQLGGIDVQSSAGDGLIGQIRHGVARAQSRGVKRIVYTEPDKHDFFEHDLPNLLNASDDDPVLIAARSPAGFETFPASQRLTESFFNDVMSSLLGVEGDYCYGPFSMAIDQLDDLDTVPASVGWGWRPFVFARAHLRGERLSHVIGDFECPRDQRDPVAAERLYRLRQLSQNLNGLLLAVDR